MAAQLHATPADSVWIVNAYQLAMVATLLGDTPTIVSAHPSPLSARRGFFGSRPFSRANALLAGQGAAVVDWAVAPDVHQAPVS